MKLYVAGPITGIKDYNKPNFDAAATFLRNEGYHAITPFDLAVVDPCLESDWNANMKRCIKYLVDMDVLVTIPGWTKSKGARLEVLIAQQIGLPLYSLEYRDNEVPALYELVCDISVNINLGS
jgi:hypothetical protein